jgi:cytochrome c-type biogenesis protein
MDPAQHLWISFLAGLFTPLGSVCVLPLYPGFLAYLAHQTENDHQTALLGVTVTTGILVSMAVAGFIFITLLKGSLSLVTGVIAPILFVMLAGAGFLMVAGVDFGRYIKAVRPPRSRGPLSGAFLFGAFFGIAALPCNPAPIIVLFAISSTIGDIFLNFLGFIIFGIGMALPLLLLSALPLEQSGSFTRFLAVHSNEISRVAGILIIVISLYYLISTITIPAVP